MSRNRNISMGLREQKKLQDKNENSDQSWSALEEKGEGSDSSWEDLISSDGQSESEVNPSVGPVPNNSDPPAVGKVNVGAAIEDFRRRLAERKAKPRESMFRKMVKRAAMCVLAILLIYSFEAKQDSAFKALERKNSEAKGRITGLSGPNFGDWKYGASPLLPLFDDEQLGYDNGKSYLVILGHVIDVSKDYERFGIGGDCIKLLGKESARDFLPNYEFEMFDSDDEGERTLTPSEYSYVVPWLEFFLASYQLKGYYIGVYYTLDGFETESMKNIQNWAKQSTDISKYDNLSPPCGKGWNKIFGATCWCSPRSPQF